MHLHYTVVSLMLSSVLERFVVFCDSFFSKSMRCLSVQIVACLSMLVICLLVSLLCKRCIS